MSKFSPGPWRVRTFLNPSSYVVTSEGLAGKAFQLVPEFSTQTSDEFFTNARLIAAAPELLEALEHLLNKADAEWGDPGIWSETRNDARRLIDSLK